MISVQPHVNILIVDDDDVDVRLMKRGFDKQKIGKSVYTARDGVEALELLRGEAGREKLRRPFLILLDLNMPRMNGIQFLKEMRNDQQLSDNIVFVTTTSNDESDRAAAYAENIAGYILKTSAGDGFVSLVQMLDKYLPIVQFPV